MKYLVEIYGAQLTKGSVLFLCDPLTNKYISFIYDTLFNPPCDTFFEFFTKIWSEIQPLDRQGAFQKFSFEFFKRLACTLNASALQSRKERVHKITRQEIEGFTRLLDTYITTVTNADLSGEEIYNSLTLLSWYIHRFCKSLLRHIFPATKQIAKAFSQIIPKLPVTLHYIYDPYWIPKNFINVPEIPSEIIQKLAINDQSIDVLKFVGLQPVLVIMLTSRQLNARS